MVVYRIAGVVLRLGKGWNDARLFAQAGFPSLNKQPGRRATSLLLCTHSHAAKAFLSQPCNTIGCYLEERHCARIHSLMVKRPIRLVVAYCCAKALHHAKSSLIEFMLRVAGMAVK
jgi:hypothetical protein